MLTPFVPEPYVDFTQDQPRSRMLAALKAVGDQLGQRYSFWIDTKPVTASKTFQLGRADPAAEIRRTPSHLEECWQAKPALALCILHL